jgi:hypothetical protein
MEVLRSRMTAFLVVSAVNRMIWVLKVGISECGVSCSDAADGNGVLMEGRYSDLLRQFMTFDLSTGRIAGHLSPIRLLMR